MPNNSEEKMIFRISTKNVGPLKNSTFQITEAKHKKRFCIFANNGSGKTILSRCLSLPSLNTLATSSELHHLYPHLINLKETSFEFEFGFALSSETTKKLKISGDKFGNINIDNNTDFIFYVFNEDFVKKNIREKKYQIDSNIEGYIIGNEAINLDKQNENLESLNKFRVDLEKQITATIQETLKELLLFSIARNTTEYRDISFEKVLAGNKYHILKSFDEYVAEHNKLKSLPDDIALLDEISDFNIEDFSPEIENLSQSYTLNDFSETFKKEILSKLEFIQTGLSLSNGTTCPFCGQTYDNHAVELIDEYNKFVNDSQTEIIGHLKSLQQSINQIPNLYNRYLTRVLSIEKNFHKSAEFFPSLEGLSFTPFQSENDLLEIVNSLLTEIQRKIENISLSVDISEQISKLNTFIKDTNSIKVKNNRLIQKVNKSLSSVNNEKLSIKRNLCKSAFNKLIDDVSDLASKLKVTKEQISVVNTEIKKLQASAQIKKKDLIATTLKELLKSFFNNKYEFDEDTFKFKLLNCDVTNDLDFVLSEAEKNIIAFCYYIASIFNIVENEDELKHIFYIIDDPVSSMDFLYVYNVALIINNYCKKKYGTNILLLTHNLEFFNIVLKNGLIDVGISLHNGELKKVSDNILMPYENHLKDVYNIAKGISTPNHTTPNSIRHIIETINKFKNPQQKIEEFIFTENILNANSPIIKIIQSFSHGEIREEESYTDDMIIEACKALIEYITNYYPGQIERVKAI